MKPKPQVHLVPTDKPSILRLDGPDKVLQLLAHPIGVEEFGKPQHLYITSDEEIKEGDWFYDFLYKVRQHTKEFKPASYSRKIVATTNKDLWKWGLNMMVEKEPYPIPEPFIKLYVERYNAGNPITEVELETEDIKASDVYTHSPEQSWLEITPDKDSVLSSQLKLDSQGAVIVHEVKPVTYTREQMDEYYIAIAKLFPDLPIPHYDYILSRP
jgi:hypothetical protein